MASDATSPESVCVVAVGGVTAVGLSTPASAAAVRGGIAGFGDHPYMLDRDGEPMVVARVPLLLDDDPDPAERWVRIALAAAAEALGPLADHAHERAALTALVGLPPARPGRPAGIEDRLAAELRRSVGLKAVETLPNGHSAGLIAVKRASERLASGEARFCLVGGVDSYLDVDTLEWLEARGLLHGGENAWGFIPGEAAGFCLLTTVATAERAVLPVLARLAGAATAVEPQPVGAGGVCVGIGLTEAVRAVVEPLPEDDRVEQVLCDLNGEAYRADEYGFTLVRTAGRFVDANDFLAPADCWGDVGAATGPLLVGLAVEAARRGYARGRRSLIWTSSEAGERAAALLVADVRARS